ncbi:MAG TPA: hypothetical protein VG890_08585 [Puia sp.]|nr:hypothetical protein [Puia sp.]
MIIPCRKIYVAFILLFLLPALVPATAFSQPGEETLPALLKDFVSSIQYGKLGGAAPVVKYEPAGTNGIHVELSWELKDSVHQDDLQIAVQPAFQPTFHWAPHLTPTNDNIIAQHVFRTPALIVQSAGRQLILVPDLDILRLPNNTSNPGSAWYMDMDATDNLLYLGLSRSVVKEHVLYYRKPGAVYPPGKRSVGFYLFTATDSASLSDPWRKPLAFCWEKWGQTPYDEGDPLPGKNIPDFVNQTYDWAFGSWKKAVWQEFTLDGKKVGAPTFIVNVTQSPDWKGEVNEREMRSIWNQAWFSSLRSASGLYRYAREKKDTTLLRYALETKELALSFPQRNGFFYSVIATEMETIQKNGKSLNRSKGWNTYYFGNSNRNPFTGDVKQSPFHILDMSYTAWLMLCWYDELEKDKRLLQYATRYADALLRIQEADGFFPAWLSLDKQEPMGYLDHSPETSMSVTFLLKLYRISGDQRYREAALKALQAVIDRIIFRGQWEDFETYWSCSRYGSDTLVGKKVLRNDQFKQNTLSMYWTAQALYEAFQITRKPDYLHLGQRVLDEMLMFQASWQPPYMYVNVLGGFGVMNGDGEWNDSRQSLFAELILQYGKELQQKEYTERGLAALKASFVMMYSPGNPKTKKQWESRWNFFGKADYGFMMENYGHEGRTGDEGIGIGEFTIYDWGNGAASEAYLRIAAHFGKKYLLNNLR